MGSQPGNFGQGVTSKTPPITPGAPSTTTMLSPTTQSPLPHQRPALRPPETSPSSVLTAMLRLQSVNPTLSQPYPYLQIPTLKAAFRQRTPPPPNLTPPKETQLSASTPNAVGTCKTPLIIQNNQISRLTLPPHKPKDPLHQLPLPRTSRKIMTHSTSLHTTSHSTTHPKTPYPELTLPLSAHTLSIYPFLPQYPTPQRLTLPYQESSP